MKSLQPRRREAEGWGATFAHCSPITELRSSYPSASPSTLPSPFTLLYLAYTFIQGGEECSGRMQAYTRPTGGNKTLRKAMTEVASILDTAEWEMGVPSRELGLVPRGPCLVTASLGGTYLPHP